jgi:hypothetical protein
MDERTKLTADGDRYTIMMVLESGRTVPFAGGLTWEDAQRLHKRFGGFAVRHGRACQLIISREIALDVLAERMGGKYV